jgi:hypothetical protein
MPSGGRVGHDVPTDGLLLIAGVGTSRGIRVRHDLIGHDDSNPELSDRVSAGYSVVKMLHTSSARR